MTLSKTKVRCEIHHGVCEDKISSSMGFEKRVLMKRNVGIESGIVTETYGERFGCFLVNVAVKLKI